MLTNKIDFYCSAFAIVKAFTEGKIDVETCLDHYSHDDEICRLPLSNDTQIQIATLLHDDRNVDYVLDNFRKDISYDETNQVVLKRHNLIKRDDVLNTQRRFGLNAAQKSPLDGTSVELWYKESMSSDGKEGALFCYENDEKNYCIETMKIKIAASAVDYMMNDNNEANSSTKSNNEKSNLLRCPHCPAKIHTDHMEAHKIVCAKLRTHACLHCNRRFRQKTSLIQHTRIHTDDRPYHCRFCERNFKQKAHLDQHERIHTGEKPYACKFCGKQFRQKSGQQSHEVSHMHHQSGLSELDVDVVQQRVNNGQQQHHISNSGDNDDYDDKEARLEIDQDQ